MGQKCNQKWRDRTVKLLKNIFRVAVSNIVGFGTSFIINFFLPIILTVAAYGHYKQYVLYISFTYLFNLGFNDGIYIKYGGLEEGEVDQTLVKQEHQFVIIFQLIILALMLGYALLTHNLLIGLFALATCLDSINGFHQNYLQATGQFKTFTRGTISRSIFYIILLFIAVFVQKNTNYVYYIGLNLAAYLFLTIYFECHFLKKKGLTWPIAWKSHLHLFRVGIFILLANMSLTFVGNIGNWIVNWWYHIEEFAYYNFQNTILNVILLVVNAVGMVFYNLLSKRRDEKLLRVIKQACFLLGVGSGLAFFIFRFIINLWISKYNPSIHLLSITFISIPYVMLSRILIANLYRSTVPERRYFRDSACYVGFSFVFVVALQYLMHNILMVAAATTLCYVAWFIFSSRIKFPVLKSDRKEMILLVTHAVIFIVTANFLPDIIGTLLYLAYLAVILYCYRDWLINMKDLLTT